MSIASSKKHLFRATVCQRRRRCLKGPPTKQAKKSKSKSMKNRKRASKARPEPLERRQVKYHLKRKANKHKNWGWRENPNQCVISFSLSKSTSLR